MSRNTGAVPDALFPAHLSATEVRAKCVLKIMCRVFTVGLSHGSVGRWHTIHDKPFRSVLGKRNVHEGTELCLKKRHFQGLQDFSL